MAGFHGTAARPAKKPVKQALRLSKPPRPVRPVPETSQTQETHMSRVNSIATLVVLAQAAFAGSAEGPSQAPVPAGTYQVDKAHTSLLFRVDHLGFSTYTGRFTRLDAQLQFDPNDLASSRVTVN